MLSEGYTERANMKFAGDLRCRTFLPFDISPCATYNLALDARYCRVNTRLLTEDPMLQRSKSIFQLERTVKWTFEFW